MRLGGAVLLALLAGWGCGGKSSAGTQTEEDQAPFAQGVASGEVSESRAILWTRAAQTPAVTAEVATDEQFTALVATQELAVPAEGDFIVKVEVSGLSPATSYFYRFRSGEASSPVGRFRTAPAPDTSSAVRFSWASDTDVTRTPDGFAPLARAREDGADFFIWLGDTAYMDASPAATDLAAMRARHRQTREVPALADLLGSTATFATWDDHEVRNDYSPTSVEPGLLASGRRAFEDYMPLRPADPQLGFYRTARWGKELELFFLDERSFRSSSALAACQFDQAPTLPAPVRAQLGLSQSPPAGCLAAIADPARTLLGPTQKQRLFADLAASQATWKFIVSQVAMSELFALPYDRWEGYAAERAELIEFVRAAGLRNVVVITGDLHANIVTDVRANAFTDPTPRFKEFIAGPVAQTTLYQQFLVVAGSAAAADSALNQLRAASPADCLEPDARAYGLVEIDPASGALKATIKDGQGAVVCEHSSSTSAIIP